MLINNYLRTFLLKNFLELFFPQTCINCSGYVEEHHIFICYRCISEIPLTNYSCLCDNPLEISFKGRVDLISGTSLMFYEKGGLVQKLMYELKYNQKPSIASFFGRWLGAEMLESGRFETIDIIIPMPLHKEKRRKRGYNQSEYFGKSLAQTMGKVYRDNLLFRVADTASQTRKNRAERMQASDIEYTINGKANLIDKHVLIVDDIITSGATLQSSTVPLLTVPGIRLSFASIAITP